MIRNSIAALALVLSVPAHAADRCTELADLAAAVAEHRDAGIPQAAVAAQLRVQYRQDTEGGRNAAAMTEQVAKVVYQDDKAPAVLRREVKDRCEAGKFDQR